MRAFICIDLPEDVKAEITKSSKVLNLEGIRLVGEDQLHITLFFFAEIDDEAVKNVINVLDGLHHEKFKIEIGDFGIFDPKRPNVIFRNIDDSGKIRGIFDWIKPKISDFVEIEGREFAPHLTVARIKDPDRETAAMVNQAIKNTVKQLSFECDRITLKQSTLTSRGPVYEDLHVKLFG